MRFEREILFETLKYSELPEDFELQTILDTGKKQADGESQQVNNGRDAELLDPGQSTYFPRGKYM